MVPLIISPSSPKQHFCAEVKKMGVTPGAINGTYQVLQKSRGRGGGPPPFWPFIAKGKKWTNFSGGTPPFWTLFIDFSVIFLTFYSIINAILVY